MNFPWVVFLNAYSSVWCLKKAVAYTDINSSGVLLVFLVAFNADLYQFRLVSEGQGRWFFAGFSIFN